MQIYVYVAKNEINSVLAPNNTKPPVGTILNNKLYIDGLIQDCSISIYKALEILQSCAKASPCLLQSFSRYWCNFMDQLTPLMSAIAFHVIGSISSHGIDLALLEHSPHSARSINWTTCYEWMLIWANKKMCLECCLLKWVFLIVTTEVPGKYCRISLVILFQIINK